MTPPTPLNLKTFQKFTRFCRATLPFSEKHSPKRISSTTCVHRKMLMITEDILAQSHIGSSLDQDDLQTKSDGDGDDDDDGDSDGDDDGDSDGDDDGDGDGDIEPFLHRATTQISWKPKVNEMHPLLPINRRLPLKPGEK